MKTLVVFHYEYTHRYAPTNEWTNGYDKVEDTRFNVVIPGLGTSTKAHDALHDMHHDDEYFRILSESYYPIDLELK